MITLPSDILQGAGWDGKSTVSTSSGDKEYDNLESAMDFAEHQRIVVAARSLLVNYSNLGSGWGESDDAKAAKAAFTDLKACYESSTSPHALYITKGIHQRATNAHIQLVLSVPGSGKRRTFHLNVTATLENVDRGVSHKNKFVWGAAQFSWSSETTNYAWPKAATRVTRARGQSISLATHTVRANEIAEIRASEAFGTALTTFLTKNDGFCKTADRKRLYGGTPVPMKVKKSGAMKTLSYNPDTKAFTLG
jgi:hypothetical protein